MENCLVKKLKSSVDNANLLKLGEIPIICEPGGNHLMYAAVDIVDETNPEKISCPIGLSRTKDGEIVGTELPLIVSGTPESYWVHNTSNENVVIKLYHKYLLTQLGLGSLYLNDSLSISQILGMFSNKINLLYLDTGNDKIEGSIDLFASSGKDFGHLRMALFRDIGITGNIENFPAYNSTLITNIVVNNSAITGSFDILLNKMASGALSTVSKTVSIEGNGLVTLQNEPFNGSKTIIFDGQGGWSVQS